MKRFVFVTISKNTGAVSVTDYSEDFIFDKDWLRAFSLRVGETMILTEEEGGHENYYESITRIE